MGYEIYGDTKNVAKHIIAKLELLYEVELEYKNFATDELLQKMAEITTLCKKEVAVYLNRHGRVVSVSLGDKSTAPLPQPKGRRGSIRTNGIRCIHTHPNGSSHLSPVDINSLHILSFDAMAAVAVRDGRAVSMSVALPTELHIVKDIPQDEVVKDIQSIGDCEILGPFYIYSSEIDKILFKIRENDKLLKKDIKETSLGKERIILVSVELPGSIIADGKTEGEISLDELEELSETAGCVVLDKIIQKRQKIDTAYVVGKGKIEEIAILRQALGANILAFDRELSGTQVRNIQALTGACVLDRTNLILDIFAQRAKSKEGKIQVELAQLKYSMPQLLGLGKALSRQGGGIGSRGPGESMLETDRRHILRRIAFLEKQLDTVKKQRETIHSTRNRNNMPVFALVGYTNAGKSTLLNKMCGSDVFVEDKLFATLDPTTRSFELNNSEEGLLTDTVGFIRKLPHHLVEAFKSTLEEALYADVILHIVDYSSQLADNRIEVVEKILKDLGAGDKPVILVLNKCDMESCKDNHVDITMRKPYVEISAVTGKGIDDLIQTMNNVLETNRSKYEILVPYDKAGIINQIHNLAASVSTEYNEDGICVNLTADQATANKIFSLL